MFSKKYEIGVEISGDSRGLRRATDEANRSLKSLGKTPSNIRSGFEKLGQSFWNFSKGAALAGGAGFTLLLKQGSKLAYTTKLNDARLKQLGATTQERAELMRKMSEVSRQCSVSMADLTNSTVQFYSAGIKNSDVLADKMKMISDAALFSGSTFKEMGFVMSKALAGGFMDLGEFWQLNERGVMTLNDLVGVLGKDIEKVMDNISERKLTSEIAEKIIKKKTQGFIEKAKTDIGAAIALLQNAWSAGQEAFATGFWSGLFEGMSEQDAATKLTEFAQNLAPKMEELGKKIGTAFRDAFEWIKENRDVVHIIGEIVAGFTALMFVCSVFAKIGAAISFLLTPFGKVLGLLGLISIASVYLYNNWEQVKATGERCFNAVKDKLHDIWDALKRFAHWIVDPFVDSWHEMKDSAVAAFNTIKSAAHSLIDTLTTVIQKIREVVNGTSESLGARVDYYRRRVGHRQSGTPGFLSYYNHIRGYADGGFVRVNERGGEIIGLPNGSFVIPHDYSNKLMNNRTGFDYDIFNQMIRRHMDNMTDRIVDQLSTINIHVEDIQNGDIFKI